MEGLKRKTVGPSDEIYAPEFFIWNLKNRGLENDINMMFLFKGVIFSASMFVCRVENFVRIVSH